MEQPREGLLSTKIWIFYNSHFNLNGSLLYLDTEDTIHAYYIIASISS